MKKAIVILVACALAQLASAQVSVPYEIAFETNVSVGSTILSNINAGAWQGTAEAKAFVTNLLYSSDRQSPVVNYPLSGDHSNVLKFSDGTISNAFVPSGLTQIWLDTMIQPVRSDSLPTNEPISSSQVSLAFDTNGFLNVYHGIMSTPAWETVPDIRQWTQLTGFGPVATGKWVRVTIAMKHMTGDEKQSFFQIKMNGVVLSNAAAYVSAENPSSEYTTGGSWFLCANYNGFDLHQLALSGSGMMDDLVVTNGEPAIIPSAASVYVTFVGQGSVSPSGTVTLVANPGETNFGITPSPYYRIASVYTGLVEGASNSIVAAEGEVPYNLTWANITADSTLFVMFAPQLVTNGVPVYWMAEKGLSTNGTYPTWNDVALYDEDGDGMLTWAEYIAKTHPDNSNSILKIISQTFSNGAPRITWLSSTEALIPYAIQLSTNLVDSPWSNVSNVTASGTGTNVLEVSTPAATPAFYRVTVTN